MIQNENRNPTLPGGTLRLAVVGLGKMGLMHLASLRRISGVEVSAVVDVDAGKSRLAALQGVPFFTSSHDILGRVDAAIVATPATEHTESTLPLLAGGIHCLVEKPLAMTLPDIEWLGGVATRHAALLAVGQSERFNPGVASAQAFIASKGVRHIHVLRKQVTAGPIETELDVVQDLMIHDLDWIVRALRQLPENLSVTDARWVDQRLESVTCTLAFPGAIQVVLEASRMGPSRQRNITLHDGHAAVVIPLDQRRGMQPDALTRQAAAFLGLVREQATSIATWQEALDVMVIVDRIRASCRPPVAVGEDTALAVHV